MKTKRVNPLHYTKKYYLSHATGYEEFNKSFGEMLEPRMNSIVKKLSVKRGFRVLDIGCGRGELIFWLVKNGALEAIGIDYSKDAIDIAKNARLKKSIHIRNKTKFYVMDAKGICFHNKKFDAIFMTEVLEHLYLEEQDIVLDKINKILKDNGYFFFHTSPSRWFYDFTYKYWCYPVSTILVKISNLFTGNNYSNIEKPNKLRPYTHKVMHVNEPDYLSLKKMFNKHGFVGPIRSSNVTIAKPILSWKDALFNFLVYLSPLSNIPPFNILWGNDFHATLKKK